MNNAIFMNTIFPFAMMQSTDKQAKSLIETARKAADSADSETTFGTAAKNSFADLRVESLVEIAIWHFERSLKNYRIAIANLEKAKQFNLSPKYKKYIDAKTVECFQKANEISVQRQNTQILLNK